MTPEAHEDAGLVRAARRGDEAAWRTLYGRHFQEVYRYAYFRTGRSRERAEDVTAEVWMTAVRRLRTYDAARGTFRGWLTGIADKVIANRARKQARRVEALEQRATPEGNGHDPALDVPDLVAAALAGLSEEYRVALDAKYRRGLTVRELSAESGRGEKAVESLLSRARAAFRAEVERLEREA